MRLVRELGVEIGERVCGSPAAVRATEVVAAAFQDLGLEPRFQNFEFVGYQMEEPELEIEGERWEAGPCMYSAPTPAEGATGRVRRIGTNVWSKDLFEVPVFAIEDDSGREVGRLCGNPFGGGAIPFLVFGLIVGPPQVYISSTDAERLDSMEGARARLRVNGRFVPSMSCRNVLAELPGESDEVVVVSAHHDSVWHGPGVIDNATGVEGVRRVAERLAGRTLPRTVIFAAWAAEEIQLQGSRWFVEEAKIRGLFDRIVGAVNLDCIGHGRYLTLHVGPDELRDRAVEEVDALGLRERYELKVFGPVAGTDHYWFAQHGVPAASILHFPYSEYHQPEERIELVDERYLEDAVDLAVALTESQLARPVTRRDGE